MCRQVLISANSVAAAWHGHINPHQSTSRGLFSRRAALNGLRLDLAMSSKLKFSIECRDTKPGQAIFGSVPERNWQIEPGQAVYVVGSVPELGCWQVGQGPLLV